MSKYCHFHEDYGHDTNDCRQLRNHIEEAVKSGQLTHLVKGIKKEKVKASENQQTEGKKDKSTTPAEAPILMIRQDESYTKNKFEGLTTESKEITFPSGGSYSSAPVVIKAKVFGREVNRVHMDSGSSCKVIYEHCFMKLKPCIRASKETPPLTRKETLDFVIVKSDSPYNMLLGRTAMQKIEIMVSTFTGPSNSTSPEGLVWYFRHIESDKIKERMKKVRETPPVKQVKKGCSAALRLRDLLRANADVFAWTYADMTGIPRTITAYVDDMVIKSTFKEEMLADIKETFEKFRSINMKLNPKKCSFGVKEGPFLGHLITKQGIRANPSKVKSITDVEQPKTLKDVQSLNGKITALSRFLSKGAKRLLPFFKVLKSCTDKKNIQWTQQAEAAL
ncbi:reverse transcriptase domain-containing protein [Tanacetum coccineum]